jgi:hypothetical protein
VPSAGIMASGVMLAGAPAVPIFTEDFDAVAEYTGTTPTLRTGVTGVCGAITGSGAAAWAIPVVSQTDTITMGFRWQCSAVDTNRSIIQLRTDTDTGGTNVTLLRCTASGQLNVVAGGTAGATLFLTAAGLVVAATWYYLELRVRMHDTLGFAELRLDGVLVGSAYNVDTRPGGTKTVFDSVSLQGAGTSTTNRFDDLYIATDGGDFLGPQRYGTGPRVVLDEPFNSFAAWTTTGTPTIVAGRNGTGASFPNGSADFAIPSGQQDYELVVGFAVKFGALAGGNFLDLRSDASATSHVLLQLQPTGGMVVLRSLSTVLATVAAGTFTTGVWYYLELQALLHDTAGTVVLRKDGVVVASAVDVDAKNAGTKTVLDTVRILSGAGPNPTFDDLYIRTGTLAVPLGDHAVP